MNPCQPSSRTPAGARTLIALSVLTWALLLWTGIVATACTAAQAATGTNRPVSSQSAEGFEPRLGTYFYIARWEGSKILEATITVQQQAGLYRILVDSRTTGVIDAVFKIRYRGEGHLRAEDLMPVKSVMNEQQRKKSKETEIYYLDDGGIEIVQTRTKKKKAPRTSSRTVRPEAVVLEPFSATFLARGFNWSEGEIQQFEVITGKSRYLVTLFCEGIAIVEESGTQTEAWVIRPALRNLTKPGKKSKITKAKIYLSADPHKDLLKMKTETRAGTVTLKMKDFVAE